MNWDWFSDTGHIGLALGLGSAVPIYLTLRHMLEVLKCINTNLAILCDRLAPPHRDDEF